MATLIFILLEQLHCGLAAFSPGDCNLYFFLGNFLVFICRPRIYRLNPHLFDTNIVWAELHPASHSLHTCDYAPLHAPCLWPLPSLVLGLRLRAHLHKNNLPELRPWAVPAGLLYGICIILTPCFRCGKLLG